MELFTLFGKILTNSDQANKDIDGITNKAESSESKISSAFKKVGAIIAGAFVVDKVIDFGKKMVETTAEVQALDSQFTQTFKNSGNTAMELINKQSKDQNIQVDRLKGTWSSFFGTFRGNGADVNKSLDLTKGYMNLAADGAAYYDTSLEDVVSRLKSITMGNYEAGDAIGININATKLDTIAKEKYHKKLQDLSDTEREYLILDTAGKIYKNSGAMGQAAREANNYSNVVENLKATWSRFLSIIGAPVLNVVINALQGITGVITQLTARVQSFNPAGFASFIANVSNAGKTVKPIILDLVKDFTNFAISILPSIGNASLDLGNKLIILVTGGLVQLKNGIDWLTQHGQLVKAVIIGITTSVVAYKVATMALVTVQEIQNGLLAISAIRGGSAALAMAVMRNSTTSATAAQWLLNAALNANPIGLVVIGIGALVAAGILLYKNWDTVSSTAKKLWQDIQTAFNNIGNSVVGTWNNIKSSALDTWVSIVNSVEGFINRLNNTLHEHQTAITVTATILGTIFGPALIMSGIQAITAGAQIASSFIASVISSGASAIVSGAQITSSFIVSVIQAGITGVTTGAQIFASFVASMVQSGVSAVTSAAQITGGFIVAMIQTGAQAIATGTAITGNLIVSVVSYAAQGWQAVGAITAQTVAWGAQKAQLIISTGAVIAHKVATTAVTGATKAMTVAQYALNVAMSLNPIGIIIGLLVALGAGLVLAYNKSETFRNIVNNAFNAVKNTAEWVVNGVIDAWNSLWNKISSIGNSIKNLWNSIWSFKIPHIPLPHFNISGNFSLVPPSMPSVGLEWYANGGILTKPMPFGVNPSTGNVMAGGESSTGGEAIIPLNRLPEIIAEALIKAGIGQNQTIYLQIDGKTFAATIAPYTDQVNGTNVKLVERGLIV